MNLIEEIEIRSFRSIKSISLSGLDDFTSLAGLNNSGKSNILRALNAFFSGNTDDGIPLNVYDDFYRPDLKKHKAKKIEVAITFKLPEHFKFRKYLEGVEGMLGSRRFTIAKIFHIKSDYPSYTLDGRELDLEERLRADQFLQLINFRYIPNRVLPIDVIKQEHRALMDVLVRRLGQKAKGHEKTFEAIQEISESLVWALNSRITEASPDVGNVRLATPTSWADMAFTMGYKLGQGDMELDDFVQGSGIQSLLMFETLYLIDRDYFQKFGWKQAAVWIVEEPESSLHASLEARVASYLASISSDPGSRLQVLCTTHSDLMIQYSGKSFLIEKDGFETTFKEPSSPREAIEELSNAGVSRWVHPLLYHPLDPIIIVDGKYDHAFWTEALKIIRIKGHPVITYLEIMDASSGTGGNKQIYNYVKANSQVIRKRPKNSPVVVVLDWEDSGNVQSYKRLFGRNDPFLIFCWPEGEVNPKLSKSFRGTERFYSDRIIAEARNNGLQVAEYSDGTLTVESDHYNNTGKHIICDVVKQGLMQEDLQYARSFMENVLRKIGMM